MFNKKSNTNNGVGIHFHPGIFKFKLPYLVDGHFPLNEGGLAPIYYCDLEFHVGDQRDLDNGILITVIISAIPGGIGVTNFIENLATLIIPYLDQVNYGETTNILERIRFIERVYYPEENYSLVSLTWDKKNHKFTEPKWSQLPLFDWIIEGNTLEKYEKETRY
ncbi:hypothetical protein [Gottfriedia solisilvae]|uniref:hypothetical protein n=1 Tax=Gottfriedia solisilvae TaxID=1516104 RepID=UPI003D2EF586